MFLEHAPELGDVYIALAADEHEGAVAAEVVLPGRSRPGGGFSPRAAPFSAGPRQNSRFPSPFGTIVTLTRVKWNSPCVKPSYETWSSARVAATARRKPPTAPGASEATSA